LALDQADDDPNPIRKPLLMQGWMERVELGEYPLV
jgi:hypothetical protein